MIDDLAKWDDINEIRKSTPGLGISVSTQYMLDQISIAYESLSKKVEFLTKQCCVKQSSSQAWLNAQDVLACTGDSFGLAEMQNCYCTAGIDLSMSTDLCCCCIIVEKGGELYVVSHYFLPGARIKDAEARDGVPYQLYMMRGLLSASGENYIDLNDVFLWMTQLIEKWSIYPLAVGYDPYGMGILTSMMENYGFKMSAVKQGENLTGIINEVDGRVADHNIHIGDNDITKIHFLDSALKVNAENNRRRLVKLNTKCHIDGMAAFLDAMCMRSCFNDEIGQQLTNEG